MKKDLLKLYEEYAEYVHKYVVEYNYRKDPVIILNSLNLFIKYLDYGYITSADVQSITDLYEKCYCEKY